MEVYSMQFNVFTHRHLVSIITPRIRTAAGRFLNPTHTGGDALIHTDLREVHYGPRF